MGQTETLRSYPEGTSNTEFATAVYNNVLGRTPDQAGFDFWVNSSNSGLVSRDQFILKSLVVSKTVLLIGPIWIERLMCWSYFAVNMGLSDTLQATAVMALYDGSSLSLISVKQAVDNYHISALDPLFGDLLPDWCSGRPIRISPDQNDWCQIRESTAWVGYLTDDVRLLPTILAFTLLPYTGCGYRRQFSDSHSGRKTA